MSTLVCLVLGTLVTLGAATSHGLLPSPALRQLQQNAECKPSNNICRICNNGICEKCLRGWFIDNEGACQDCDVPACDVCTGLGNCQECAGGYYVENDRCLRCRDKIENCKRCKSAEKCDECAPGYQGPRCTRIEGCDPNCDRCENQDQCDVCKPGYYLENNSPGRCLSCSTVPEIPDCEKCFWANGIGQPRPKLICLKARGVNCERDIGTDYPGNDLTNTPFDINTATLCCQLCQKTPECNGWLWRRSFKHCWLKSKMVNPEPCSDCVAMKI